MIRPLTALACVLALTACAGAPPTDDQGIERALAAGAPQAYYGGFPAALFAAHAEICSRPGERLVRPSREEIRCEMLLPPEATAGLILEYGGTVEDLPRMVISFVGRAAARGGWVVTSDSYLRVPRREGGVAELRVPDPELQETMRELLALSGGEVL